MFSKDTSKVLYETLAIYNIREYNQHKNEGQNQENTPTDQQGQGAARGGTNITNRIGTWTTPERLTSSTKSRYRTTAE